MKNSSKKLESYISKILSVVGDDPERDGLLETPKRVISSWKELYGGYNKDPEKVLKIFECNSYKGMVLLKNIELYSMCEHHMLPFVGKCHIAYIPNEKVVGISKLARIMEIYARRLQIQERLTDEIADCLMKVLAPKGVAIQIEAEHFCMRMRGVNKQNSTMTTTTLRGLFLNDFSTRNEFLNAIR